jgi:phosphoserine phosphatase
MRLRRAALSIFTLASRRTLATMAAARWPAPTIPDAIIEPLQGPASSAVIFMHGLGDTSEGWQEVIADALRSGPTEVSGLVAVISDDGRRFGVAERTDLKALAARLTLLAPSRGAVDAFVAAHAPALTPGLAALVAALQARGTAVYLVSGGFTQMILPVADALRVPRARVHANTLLFDAATGAFAGFDEAAPTSRDGGKAAVLRALKAAHGYAPLIMVGDGATDLQARPPADAFVGYGGVVEREVVRKGADWFVKDWAEFTALVEEGARA